MYGEGRNLRYIIGAGLVIVLLFVIIFMIVRSGGDEATVPETQRELTSYAADPDIAITQTTVGPIVAPQNHDEIEITVTNTSATINVIKGYDGNVVNSRTYPMSTESFREFLSALNKAKFTEGNINEELTNDEGYCSTGQRYIFEVKDGAKNVQRFWTTSCGGTKTYKGNTNLTLTLFRQQIPDYNEITENTQFVNGFFDL